MDVSLELTKRQQTPRWFGISIQIFTVLAALSVASLALLAVDLNPLAVYGQMFLGAVTDQFQASRVLNRSAPLILAGLAVYIPLRSGLYNIGAEGQLIMGGLVTLWVGVNVPDLLGVSSSGVITLILAFLAAAVVGAIWVLVPVVLYAKYRANEILTTLMLVFTAERLSNFLISGPLQSSAGTFPRTARVDISVPTLFGRVHVGILLAVLAVIATWLLINKTRLGYEIVLSGSNDSVAEQTGISTGKITFVVFTIAAGFAGLAGFMEVAASQPTLTLGWQPGYGWTAIPIALLGRRGAFQTMAAGLMFGVIFVGGLVVETSFGVPSAIAQIIEALLILFLITAEFMKTYQFDVRIGTWSLRESLAGIIGSDRLEGT